MTPVAPFDRPGSPCCGARRWQLRASPTASKPATGFGAASGMTEPFALAIRCGYARVMRHQLPAVAAALLTITALLVLGAGTASATISSSASMTLPAGVAVGQEDRQGSVTVSNTNTAPHTSESNVVTLMRLALSCGSTGTTANPCPLPDPGVFAISPTASGAAGTSCAGSTFTVSAPDADGIVTFTRQGGALVLPPPSGVTGANSCRVNFTFDVLKVPTIDAEAPTAGPQTRANFHARSQGQITQAAVTNNLVSLPMTVLKATPTLATSATDGAVGQPIRDTATVTSRVAGNPTGTVTFNLYGPDDPTCAGNPVFTSPNRPLSAGSATSTDYVPTVAGSYRWRASYSGDANHDPVNALCNAPNETSVVASAPSGTMTSASAKGDFNGDGVGDMAVGTPDEDLAAGADAGVVHVLYGGAGGVTATGSQLWSQDSAGIIDSPEAFERFGAALSAGDFNGDGHDDLAIGAPGEDLTGGNDAGAVHVIYGSASGLTSIGSQQFTQDTAGIADNVETGDGFGSALAAGPLDSGVFADLVVGVPREPYGTTVGAGAVHVLPGSAGGVTASGSKLYTQNTPGIADSVDAGDGFGGSLAVGDMNSVAGQDLAIGAAGENVGAASNAGVVHVLYAPLGTVSSTLWNQETAGIADNAETGDGFGSALAVGKLNSGDAIGDLIIGVPREPFVGIADAGAVHVLRGTASGVTATGAQFWTQNSAGIADSAEAGDLFGAALAADDVNTVGSGQDVAIGAPGEDVGAVADAGVVHALYGSATGLTSSGSQLWSQNTAGIADTAETGDAFGSVLAIGPLNIDAFADLVVGAPGESVGAVAGAGAVHVLRGSAVGLTATSSQQWTQDSAGIADSAETGDGFGSALGA